MKPQPISTQNLSRLPDIAPLKKLFQSLAMLDAIMIADWESRYYSFNSAWNAVEQMASMRNGSGDDYFALFTPSGVILKGFAHESSMSPYRMQPPQVWPGVYDNVPPEFATFLLEPAFTIDDVTFCIWRLNSDDTWQRGNIEFHGSIDPDGSEELLAILDGNPATYRAWAEEYYERDVPLAAIKHVYQQRPLTKKIIEKLNPDLCLDDLEDDIAEIGYPT